MVINKSIHDHDDLSQKIGLRLITQNGTFVRSKIEKIIADNLFEAKIDFQYEPSVIINGREIKPTFYLPEFGLYYDHFDADGQVYIAAAKERVKEFRKNGLAVIFTTFLDERYIEEAIGGLLYCFEEGNIEDYWPEN